MTHPNFLLTNFLDQLKMDRTTLCLFLISLSPHPDEETCLVETWRCRIPPPSHLPLNHWGPTPVYTFSDACWACVRFKRRKVQLGMRASLQFDNFYLHQKRKMLSVSTWEPMKVAQTKSS